MDLGLLVGLGNPGPRYEGTRHNFGFMVVDAFAESRLSGSSWKEMEGALVRKGSWKGKELLLVKPMTYMNRSGEPLSRVLRFYKRSIEDIVVAHDELDLSFGVVRLKRGGGEGGHNGLKSISTCLGSKEYLRLRLGIGRPAVMVRGADGALERSTIVGSSPDVADWVLSRFSKDEAREVDSVVKTSVEMVAYALEHGVAKAQGLYHGGATK